MGRRLTGIPRVAHSLAGSAEVLLAAVVVVAALVLGFPCRRRRWSSPPSLCNHVSPSPSPSPGSLRCSALSRSFPRREVEPATARSPCAGLLHPAGEFATESRAHHWARPNVRAIAECEGHLPRARLRFPSLRAGDGRNLSCLMVQRGPSVLRPGRMWEICPCMSRRHERAVL